MKLDTHDAQLAALEALLFLHGEALSFKKIALLLEIKDEEVLVLVEDYRKKLGSADRGTTLILSQEKAELVTKPDFAPLLHAFAKEELTELLTPASLETLSLIAYLGPVSKAKIEYLRGVNSAFTLRSLSLRGLIERSPDPEHAQSFLYRLSFDALKHLGVSRKEDLPDYTTFQSLMQDSGDTTPVSS